jgi:dolichyl-phosphate beta-glucosyltransferase
MLKPYLSIVIPVYNEEKRIGATLDQILAYLAKQSYTRELILVDDGSSDKGIELASQKLSGHKEFRVVSYGGNRGKGYALKQGILASRGEYVLFTDADLSTPITELDQMWSWLAPTVGTPHETFPIVHGSRKMPGAVLERHQPWLRENMGKVFTRLSNLLVVGQGITDVTCGFKAYRGEVARQVYALQSLYDWSFDAELIFIARQLGYAIKEVPVHWHDEQGTKVRLVRDSIRAFQGLLHIRLNQWRGCYTSQKQGQNQSNANVVEVTNRELEPELAINRTLEV